jgi:hypothetical protein
MKNLLRISLATPAVATIGVATPANAAPSGPSTADAKIDRLQARGFDAVVNRTGDDLVTTLMGKTVYVYLSC